MKRILLGLLVVAAGAGCTRAIDGGPETSETRTLGAFNRLTVKDAVSVQFAEGDPSVTIDTQQEVLKVLYTEVRAGELLIGIRPGVQVSDLQWTRVTVTGHDLRQISVEDSAAVSARDLTGSPFVVNAKDSGSVDLVGETQMLQIRAQDSADVNSVQLAAQSVDVVLQDASSAEVQAVKSVGGNLQDGSRLGVKGTTDFSAVVVGDASTVSAL